MAQIQQKKVIPSTEEVEAKTKELKKDKNQVIRVLKDSGLFDKVMTQQIEALSMDWGLTKVLHDKIIKSGEEPIFEMMTQNGDTYKQINPIWSLYLSFRKLMNDDYTKMGMNVYGKSKAEIGDSDEDSPLENYYREIQKIFRNNSD